jgi:hypothetical protein
MKIVVIVLFSPVFIGFAKDCRIILKAALTFI